MWTPFLAAAVAYRAVGEDFAPKKLVSVCCTDGFAGGFSFPPEDVLGEDKRSSVSVSRVGDSSAGLSERSTSSAFLLEAP